MERRTHPRVPLDAPIFIAIDIGGRGKQSVLLVDISRGGLQASLPPSCNEAAYTLDMLGGAVVVYDLPEAFTRGAGGAPGYVSWVSDQRIGVRFLHLAELSDEELEDITRTL